MTNNKQQTAVDSIIELCQELIANHYSISHDAVCSEVIKFCQEQAKEMERCQHRNTWIESHIEQIPMHFEKYFEKTYGGNK
jgi:Leu/Phe-tRNA-protein transferase